MVALLVDVAKTRPAVIAGRTMPPPVALNVAFETAPTTGAPAEPIELAVIVTKLPLIEPVMSSVPTVVILTLPDKENTGVAAIAAVTGLVPPPTKVTVGAAVKPVPTFVKPTDVTTPKEVLITAVAAAKVPPPVANVTVGAAV
jgi:hypothetical protein